jgi:hypothetical protein
MSISNFVPRHVIALQPETGFARPSELPEMVRLDSPALDVRFHRRKAGDRRRRCFY